MSEPLYSLNSPYFRKKYMGSVQVIIKGEDTEYLGNPWWEFVNKFEECRALSLRLFALGMIPYGKIFAVQIVDPPCGLMEIVHESELTQITHL